MQPKARMTIRFDPPRAVPRPLAEVPTAERVPNRPEQHPETIRPDREPVKEDQVPGTSAYYSGGPLQDDLYTLEEMIRGTESIQLPGSAGIKAAGIKPDAKAVRQQSHQVEKADWMEDISTWSPETETETSPGTGPQVEGWISGALTRREGPSWWRVFVSVAGAVATGALFGYLVLTLFTGNSPIPTATGKGSDAPAQAPAQSASDGSQTAKIADPESGASSGMGDTSAVSESSYYLLQYGVFRSEESMNAAMEELKAKGLPAAADRTDGYRVYAGASDTKEEAELLAAQMAGVEVYVKSSVSEAVRPADAEGGAQLAAFLQYSADLTRLLSRLSVEALRDELPQPIDQETLRAMRDSRRLWLESAKGIAAFPASARETAATIEQSLNAATVSVDDYERKLSRFHLWKIQEDVMTVILSDRALRSALQSDG